MEKWKNVWVDEWMNKKKWISGWMNEWISNLQTENKQTNKTNRNDQSISESWPQQ